MHKTLGILVGLMAVVLVGSCWSTDLYSDWDHDVDFSAYKTFAWLEMDEEDRPGNQLPEHLDLRLRRVVDDVLTKKGLQRAPVVPMADLLLTYYVSIEKELKVSHITSSYYGSYGYGYWPGYSYATQTTVREYDQGTVVIDLVDRKTKQLVWTSHVKKAVRDPNPSGKRIEKTAKKMFKGFPPKP